MRKKRFPATWCRSLRRLAAIVLPALFWAGFPPPGQAMILYDLDQITGDLRILGSSSLDHAGYAVTAGEINGDGLPDLVVGAPGHRLSAEQTPVGAVFVIYGSDSLPPQLTIDLSTTPADLTILGRLPGDRIGNELAVGDLNRDGLGDIIFAGDQVDTTAGEDAGTIYVLFGSDAFPPQATVDLALVAADLEIYGGAAYDHAGYGLAVGDVNGDQGTDLVFSLMGYDPPGREGAGAAAVLYGSSSLTSGSTLDLAADPPDLLLLGRDPGDWLGSAVAAADVNGDQVDDLILGALFADPAGRNMAGEVYLVYGSSGFPAAHTIDLGSATPGMLIEGAEPGDRIGFVVGGGRLNGDGCAEVIAGAHLSGPAGRAQAGRCYVLFGAGDIPPGQEVDLATTPADLTFVGASPYDELAYGVDSGDLNGDGIGDLLMGAIGLDPPGGEWAGGLYAVYGSTTFPPQATVDFAVADPDVLVYGDDALEEAGVDLASADFNGDGLDDLAIGAFQASSDTGGEWCGVVYVLRGCQVAAPPAGPSPADGAADVPLDLTLSWTAGPEADTFDLRFGTVSPPPLYASGLTGTFHDLPPLVSGQHYYWQVEAVNECSATASSIWDFVTCFVPSPPGSPDPPDGAAETALMVTLDWSDPPGAESYSLYFGDSSPPGLYASGLTESQYALPALDEGTQYFWRVEAMNGCGQTLSAEWTFGTCVIPDPPQLVFPPDGAEEVVVPLTLDWSAVAEAMTYNLYLGESSPPPLYQAGLTGSDFTVDGLEAGVAYFWMVEAVNNCGPVPSAEWSFTTYLWQPLELLAVGPGPGEDNPPRVRIFDPLEIPVVVWEFDAYGIDRYGVNVAAGDLGGDRLDELVTGPGPGAVFGPHVRGWEPDGMPLPGVSFIAYGTHKWGANVACGDLDGDEFAEIVTGPGPGAVFGPHVRGWNVDGGTAAAIPGVSFLAYGTHKWGVRVACGDIDGDGYDEIVTSPGPGEVFGPHIRGWNVDGGTAAAIPGVSFMAYGTHKWGANAACGDVDGDGIDEILTGPGPGSIFQAHVRGWNYDGTAVAPIPGLSWFAYSDFVYGVKVGTGDVDADGFDEILTCPGPGEEYPVQVRGWNFDGSAVELIDVLDFPAFDESFTRGGNVTGGAFRE